MQSRSVAGVLADLGRQPRLVIKDVVTGTRPAAGVGGEVIDFGGRTVMPGLIDAHVHVRAVEVDLAAQQRDHPASLLACAAGKMITQTLDQGFTTVRDAGGADWGMKEAVDRGLIPGPRMFVSGHPLTKSGGHGDAILQHPDNLIAIVKAGQFRKRQI